MCVCVCVCVCVCEGVAKHGAVRIALYAGLHHAMPTGSNSICNVSNS